MTLPNRTPDGYATRVNLTGNANSWHDDDPTEGASAREYYAYEITAEQEPDEDRYYRNGGPGLTKLMLYVDEQTGLVTADVAKFEEWLESLSRK